MKEKMTVVYVKHTGHVLAAVVHKDVPSLGANQEAQYTATELAREGLMVRFLPAELVPAGTTGVLNKTFPATPPATIDQTLTFTLNSAYLGTYTDELKLGVLRAPRKYYVAEKDNKQSLELLSTFVGTFTLTSISLNTGKFRVSVTPPLSAPAFIFFQIASLNPAEPPIVGRGTIPRQTGTAPITVTGDLDVNVGTLPVSLSHNALLLVSKNEPLFFPVPFT